ncbi:hypothetical protein TWF506_003229 [Arthrobotrys conoides]|uniref:Uncharacterized protein n=1 Tax=Arthrobotrys conoides TaxID=74498 RepID=A0AAN8NCE6_9PEZI
MTRRKANHPTSPPQNPKPPHQSHRRQQSHPHTSSGPSLQALHAVHDAPASLEQLNSLNFPVLQKFLPSLTRIHLTTSYSTAYKIRNSNWEKLDIEGPLFLLELLPSHPNFPSSASNIDPGMAKGMGKYHAFVLNRKGVNNLLIPLPKRIENVDTTNSVLISMLMAWEDCYGLSVFDQEGTSTASESERVGAKVLELVKEMEEIDESAAVAAAKEAEVLRKRVENADRLQAELQVQPQWGQQQQLPTQQPPTQQVPQQVPQQIPQMLHLHHHPQMQQHLPPLQMQHLHHQQQYSGSPAYMTPTAEYAGVDLMAALGPKLGIVGTNNSGGHNSGYNSGDGGYTSAASGTGGKGRKITLNELFGKPLG